MEISDFSGVVRLGNVAHLYDETARVRSDALALEMNGRTYTHDELRERSARFAGGLRSLGLRSGDRVALYVPNSLEYVVAALGALKAGTPFVPLNPQYKPREVGYRLRDSGASGVVVHDSLGDQLDEAVEEIDAEPTVVVVGGERGDESYVEREDAVPFEEVDGSPMVATRNRDDVAMQPYTSGTTGKPKGVLYTHRNLQAQSFMGFERSNLSPDEERFLSIMPLSHIAGFVNRTWQPLIRGGAVYVRDPQSYDLESVLSTIESKAITKFGAVATMYIDLLERESAEGYDLSSLEEAMQGGSKMPPAVQRRFEEMTGVELFEAYGLTETGGGTHAGFDSTFGPREGTIGQPFRATDCKIVDDGGEEVGVSEAGELLVRGPHVMAGYHDMPDATEAAFTGEGYFRTGDVARRDADNYYEIVDRKSDVIVTAGYNVYPREVEGTLHEHPSVVDVAVVGIPDDRRGETVKAYVVPNVEADPTAAELREFCLDELAAYKHPREIEFVGSIPRTVSGKPQKFKLREVADGV